MADNNVEVRIVGDASGVQPAVDQAGASVGGLRGTIADINAFLDTCRAKFMQLGGAGVEAGGAIARGMAGAVAATEAEGNAITSMIMKVHEGAESVRTFQMRAKEFAEVYVAIFAVEAVAHWVEELGGAAEKTAQMAATLGTSTSTVQALSGAAIMSGTNIDALAGAMERLDSKVLTSVTATEAGTKALHAMGISANDGRTNLQRLLTIADKFHGMEDGPKKIGLAIQLLGRSGAQAIPFLNQGSAAIEQLMDKSKELGAVNEQAVEQGERLAGSVNEAKVAWEGLKNVLTQAFGPILTELVDGFISLVEAMKQSYDSGGLIKVLFDGVSQVISGVIEILHAVGLGFSELFGSTSSAGVDWAGLIKTVVNDIVTAFKVAIGAAVFLADAFVASWDLIKAAGYEAALAYKEVVGRFEITGTALGEFMKVVGKVVWDALHLDWGSIAADWDNGMAQVKNAVAQKTNEILAITGHLKAQASSDFNAALNLGKQFDAFAKNLANDNYKPGHDDFKFKFGGGTGEVPDIQSDPGSKKKKTKDDTVQKLEEELEKKKAAWEEEQLAQDTAQEFSLQSEADFWAQALKRTDLSAKARYEITKKWIAAEQNVQKERISATLDEDKKEIFLADKNAQAKLAIVQRESAFIRRTYGENSKEARAADMAELQAAKEAADQRIRLIEAVAKAQQDAATDRVQDAEKTAEFEEQMGLISKGKLLQEERNYEQQLYNIDLQGLRLRLSLVDPQKDPEKYQAICAQIETLERQHQQKLTQIDRQATMQRTQIERDAIQSVGQTFGDNISKMITLQEGWRQGLVSIYQGLVQTVANAVSQMISQWIVLHLTKLLLGKQEAADDGARQVALAGAGGVASMAAAPFPINMTAPAFGASMAAAAAGFAVAATAAEGGDWNVHEGLYHLHESEMVLPSWAASPLRSAIEGGGGGNNFMLGGGGNDPTKSNGDAHYHFAPTYNNQDQSWSDLMHRSDREARRWFQSNARHGRLMPSMREER